jgi:hypothetical protein
VRLCRHVRCLAPDVARRGMSFLLAPVLLRGGGDMSSDELGTRRKRPLAVDRPALPPDGAGCLNRRS